MIDTMLTSGSQRNKTEQARSLPHPYYFQFSKRVPMAQAAKMHARQGHLGLVRPTSELSHTLP